MISLVAIGGIVVLAQRVQGGNLTEQLAGEKRGPGMHTIDNANPYRGLDPTREGTGKYPIIFEPLQNVQMSRLMYKVTFFIDFEPYLQYFKNFEDYLRKFLKHLEIFIDDPVFREHKWGSATASKGDQGLDCNKRPKCEIKMLLLEVRNQASRMEAYKRQWENCIARHFQICLALRQFDHLINVTYQLYQGFEKVQSRLLRTIDYIEETHSHAELGDSEGGRVRRGWVPRQPPY